MQVFRPYPTERSPIKSSHLIPEEEKHLEEGRGARFFTDLRGELPKGFHYSEMLANTAHVREDVECPLGLLALNSLDVVEPIHDQVPSPLEGLYHLPFELSAQRRFQRQPRAFLVVGRDAREIIDVEIFENFCFLGSREQGPTEAPARPGKAF